MFEQHELKTWIDQALDIAAVPAGPGVFYAFRDLDERAAFLASRYRRHIAVPRLTRSVDCFENYKLLLQPLMDFFAARGRLPNADELPETATVISALGSLKRAFRLIQNATGAEAWAEVAANRAQDLLIYLALARFDRRPALGQLPLALHRDIRALFQSYAKPASRPTPYSFRLARPKKSMSRVPTVHRQEDARSALYSRQRDRSVAGQPARLRGLRARISAASRAPTSSSLAGLSPGFLT